MVPRANSHVSIISTTGVFVMANHFYSRITLQLLGVDIIPCRVASLIDMQLKQRTGASLLYVILGDILYLFCYKKGFSFPKYDYK